MAIFGGGMKSVQEQAERSMVATIQQWLIDNESVGFKELELTAIRAMKLHDVCGTDYTMALSKAAGYANSAAHQAAHTDKRIGYYTELMYCQKWFRECMNHV